MIVGINTQANNMFGDLQIGYTNPQTIGSWALMYAIGALLSFDYILEKMKFRFLPCVLNIFIYAYMIYISILTNARFSFVIMIILLLFRILPKLSLFDNLLVRIFISVIPVIFVAVSELLFFTGDFAHMEGGSLLNGRELIWQNYLGLFSDSPLWGLSYDNIDANSFYSHNIIVDQLTMFGIFVPIVFVVAIAYIVVKKVPKLSCKKQLSNNSRLKYDAFVSFLAILIASSNEGCFFSVGAGGLFIFSFAVLFITVCKDIN